MLDSFLDVAYQHEAREQTERDAVALLKQLPEEDLLKIASGAKVAWLEPCGPGGSGSFLDKFKGTPLFDEALALEQEELQAEMTNLERRKEQRSTQQLEQGIWDMQDQLRIKKRLLELRLAQQEAGMGAQAGGGAPSPLMNAAPTPEAGAQGAGAVGAESAPVDANKTASTKLALAMGDVLKMKSLVSGNAPAHAAGAIKDRLKDAPKALGQVNKELGKFKSLSSSSMLAAKKTAAIADKVRSAVHGLKGTASRVADRAGKAFDQAHTLHPRATEGAAVGALGAAAGGVEGALRKKQWKEMAEKNPDSKAVQYAAKHPVRWGAMQGGAVGALVGGLSGHGNVKMQEAIHPGSVERARAFVRRGQALEHAAKSVAQSSKHAEVEPSPVMDGWGRELARTDFAKAADAVAVEQAATEAGTVLAKEGAGLAGLGTLAMNFAKNPKNLGTMVGAGAGALSGLAGGLRKDEFGQRHLLGGLAQGAAGGVAGGLAGHAAQNIGSAVRGGTPLGAAAKQYGTGMVNRIRDVANAVHPTPPAPMAA